jgi:hypothetical protein
MILEMPRLHPVGAPDEMPVRPLDSLAPRVKRSYVRHVGSAEIAARRATPREFKSEGGYIWQKRSGPWKKVCQEFLLVGFVISPDGRTAGLDTILADGSAVTLSSAAIKEDGREHFEQWAAYWLLDCPEPRATAFWIRSVIPNLRTVRIDATLRYVEDEERSSLRLIHLAEKVTGRPLRGTHEL